MSFAPIGNFELNPLFEILEILTLEDIYDLELAKFIYKQKNNLLPANLAKYFEIRQVDSTARTRSTSSRSAQVLHNTNIGLKSILIRSENVWKKVPNEIKDCVWFSSFKRKFKSHLLLLNFN